jgi:hypothetical protein
MRYLDISTENLRLGELAPALLRGGSAVGVVGLAAAAGVAVASGGGVGRFLEAYLVAFCFFLTISLGGLFFVLLQHLTRAGWSVAVRRLAEGLASNLPLLAVLALPLVAGLHHLYHWSHAEVVAADPLLAAKSGYLSPVFFIARLAGYFAIWIALARFLVARSTSQDSSGDPDLTRRMERLSAPGMVLFALSLNFASFDLLMSLDPHWFSTIFGVYVFAGCVVASVASLILIAVWLQARGRLAFTVTVEHYHDLGKLLFAFVVFWAYIAFSQYMLIWYANLPEETGWYLRRQSGGWAGLGLALLFGHFLLPFVALLPRYLKRRPQLLAVAAGWLLLMHWLDLNWLVMPEFSATLRLGVVDLLCLVGLGGLYLAGLARALGRHALLPERDPRLGESLAFENA